MTTFVMYAAAIISVAIVIFMLIKKMDIKITLFLMGIVLMFVGCALGNPLGGEDFVSTGSVFLDPLKVIADQFKSTISSAGFIILILGGYSAYMSAINANSVTVNVLTKPIAKITISIDTTTIPMVREPILKSRGRWSSLRRRFR